MQIDGLVSGSSEANGSSSLRVGRDIALIFGLMFLCLVHLRDTAVAQVDYHAVRGRLPQPRPVGRIEGEQLEMTGRSRPQPMQGFGNQWSGNGQLLWDGQVNDTVDSVFEVDTAGVYDIDVQLTLAPDYGIFELSINDAVLQRDIDLYSPRVELAEKIELKNVKLPAGTQALLMRLVGKHESARMIPGERLLAGIDYLHLRPVNALNPSESGTPSDVVKRPVTQPERPNSPVTRVPSAVQPLAMDAFQAAMKKHCHACHRGDEPEGDLRLDLLHDRKRLLANVPVAQKMRDALSRHEMPPEDEPQPDAELRLRLVGTLDAIVDEWLRDNHSRAPIVMRRMNRYEYNNSVRDLLQLKGDIYPLPEKTIRADVPYFDPGSGRYPSTVTVGNRTLGKNQVEKPVLTGVTPFAIDLQAEGGFNNRGSELSVSTILLESLLSLGRSVVNAPEFDDYCELSATVFSGDGLTTDVQRAKAARSRLSKLLERAFRSEVDESTLDRYHNFFLKSLREQGTFRQAMKDTVAAVIASPKFIYISESPGNESPEDPRLAAWELATRLSLFLWSTIPDEELMTVARDGSLLQPDVLGRQVTRMLEHPRSQALSQNFARQWLRLDQLIAAVPDFERFDRYYSRIGCEQWKFGLQMMLEPMLLFESIMVEDRSIMLLVDCNYTYRSEELQSWYDDEIPFAGKANRNRFDTFQQQFRRRTLGSRREGGVITNAATLTMTSAPLRTSPIVRGAWVATVIFNQPPPPPPDEVPSIEADDKAIEAKGITLRERLVQHQENASCASCHAKIDPLGFALENFDAVGRWRDNYQSGLKIDASGELFGDVGFADVVGLKDVLLEHPEWFLRAFIEHMLSYALGRELEISDTPAVDEILSRVVADDGKFSTVVQSVVRSQPFRYRSTLDSGENEK